VVASYRIADALFARQWTPIGPVLSPIILLIVASASFVASLDALTKAGESNHLSTLRYPIAPRSPLRISQSE